MTEEIKDTIEIGDYVRSFDFKHNEECYVEGTVVEKGIEIEGCDRYKIKIRRVVREHSEIKNKLGEFIYPPHNGTPTIFDDVTNGVIKVDQRSDLQQILDGDSDYCHADKVRAVYELLCEQSNSEEFQLGLLEIVHEGIGRKKKDKARLQSRIIRSKRNKVSQA